MALRGRGKEGSFFHCMAHGDGAPLLLAASGQWGPVPSSHFGSLISGRAHLVEQNYRNPMGLERVRRSEMPFFVLPLCFSKFLPSCSFSPSFKFPSLVQLFDLSLSTFLLSLCFTGLSFSFFSGEEKEEISLCGREGKEREFN